MQDDLPYEIADAVKTITTAFMVLEDNRSKLVQFIMSQPTIFPECWIKNISSHPLRDLLATLLKLDFEVRFSFKLIIQKKNISFFSPGKKKKV